MMMTGPELSQTLRSLNLRPRDLAKLLGVAPNTVQRWVKTNSVPQYVTPYLGLWLVTSSLASRRSEEAP